MMLKQWMILVRTLRFAKSIVDLVRLARVTSFQGLHPMHYSVHGENHQFRQK